MLCNSLVIENITMQYLCFGYSFKNVEKIIRKKTKESKQEVKQEVLGSIKEKKSYKTNGVNK